MQSRNPANFKGIDISSYEAAIDMADVAARGVGIVILKASEGEHTVDSAFRDLYNKAKTAGLKVGAYHFLHLGGAYTVDRQVDNFCAQISGLSLDCRAAIDIEDEGYHGGTPDQVTAQILDFAAKVQAKTSLPCVVYSNTSFIREHFTAAIKSLPLWVADYNDSGVPGDNGIYDNWAGYQYADNGGMGGVQVDLDEFTAGMLLSAAIAPVPQPAPAKPASNWTADVYTVDNPFYSVNATAGTDFDVRNADGSVAEGHEVDSGDALCIVGINFAAQLAEVYYPIASGWAHGWISNLQSLIHDKYHYQWRNGSTPETTYDASGNVIGSIDPWEYATPLFRRAGRLALLYNTAKGMESKFGFVAYDGGFSQF